MQRKLNIFVKKFDNVRFFPKGRIKRGENHYKLGHVESYSYAEGEIASRRERDGTYETCSLSHCVFSTALN